MDYINLGSTGMKVSRLSLGMMTYGAKTWREWVLEEEESKPFIRRSGPIPFTIVAMGVGAACLIAIAWARGALPRSRRSALPSGARRSILEHSAAR